MPSMKKRMLKRRKNTQTKLGNEANCSSPRAHSGQHQLRARITISSFFDVVFDRPHKV
jgi:hypothetical protein